MITYKGIVFIYLDDVDVNRKFDHDLSYYDILSGCRQYIFDDVEVENYPTFLSSDMQIIRNKRTSLFKNIKSFLGIKSQNSTGVIRYSIKNPDHPDELAEAIYKLLCYCKSDEVVKYSLECNDPLTNQAKTVDYLITRHSDIRRLSKCTPTHYKRWSWY